jgi:hypothetical protein
MTTPEQLEADIASVTSGPRVTLDQVRLAITGESYTMLPSAKVMVCELTLYNGFTVRGESAVVDPSNFREELGRQISREHAEAKVWELLGFLLQDKLHRRGLFGTGGTVGAEEAARELQVESIARACHEVNRAYCEALGDTSQPPWEEAPGWQRESAIKGVHLHLENPEAGPQASHESWMAEKIATGWKWGPVKDPEKLEHHCMVPFAQLPRDQQAKDFLFRAVVHVMAGMQS